MYCWRWIAAGRQVFGYTGTIVNVFFGQSALVSTADIRARIGEEDSRIARAFEARELFGHSIWDITVELGVSEPRVY